MATYCESCKGEIYYDNVHGYWGHVPVNGSIPRHIPKVPKISKEELTSVVEAIDVLNYAIIGYLAEKTNNVWQVEIKQEHLDFQVICRCGDIVRATRFIYFDESKIEKGGLLGVIFPYIDEVIVSWRREIETDS